MPVTRADELDALFERVETLPQYARCPWNPFPQDSRWWQMIEFSYRRDRAQASIIREAGR